MLDSVRSAAHRERHERGRTRLAALPGRPERLRHTAGRQRGPCAADPIRAFFARRRSELAEDAQAAQLQRAAGDAGPPIDGAGVEAVDPEPSDRRRIATLPETIGPRSTLDSSSACGTVPALSQVRRFATGRPRDRYRRPARARLGRWRHGTLCDQAPVPPDSNPSANSGGGASTEPESHRARPSPLPSRGRLCSR
jgi:hypothetical protein